ncbi:MAG: histidine ammonia-lyase [Candidatus Heimdallarchaeota archaeon]|nr:histidine ammonia-lyase [Candidatus Heimdallarchaeota archaeon]
MLSPFIELDGEHLGIKDFISVVRAKNKIDLSKTAIQNINHSYEIIKTILAEKRRIYGVTTGFGYLQDVIISPDDSKKLQENLVKSHASGVGDNFPIEVVRGMMLLEINKFARGNSGVNPQVVELLIKMLNCGITPIVPSKGSLGASGDLAPLAHLALVLIGRGHALYKGLQYSGSEVLKLANLSPLSLGSKDGLALLNGTQAMTSIGALTVFDARYLLHIANLAAILSMEVHQANIDCLNSLIHDARPHAGQIAVAKEMRASLEGSKRIRKNIGRQDSYSLRCSPIVHGASLDTINYVKRIIQIEMNASTDNPLIFSVDEIYSGGNFHGQPVALAMDFLGIAMAEVGNISERRVERLLNPTLSNLPAFLTPHSGLNSGFMIAQYTAAALVSENKTLAVPASVDSIPVSANQEDHVSMGTIAATQTEKIIRNLEYILAIELLCVCQAIDLSEAVEFLSPSSKGIYEQIRKKVPRLVHDRELTPDIVSCVQMIQKRELAGIYGDNIE